MIGRISGRLVYRADDHVLIDVGGVGYQITVSARTMASLPGAGEAVALYTDLLVREDLLQLFGFTSLVEKEWHRLLMGVQGIGAKASMAILGTLGADGVSRAIALGDLNAVKAAKGVGPKTAQRILIELKDKAPGVMAMGGVESGAVEPGAGGDAAAPAAPAPASRDAVIEAAGAPVASRNAQSEALSALGNLGYAPAEAAAAIAKAAQSAPEATTPELIRAALKLLAPGG